MRNTTRIAAGRTTGVERWLPILGLLLSCGCSTTLIRVAGPEEGGGSPKIERVVDLGGMPLPAQGLVRQDESDERFTPGEYVALVGKNLHSATAVTVGGVVAPVSGYLKGGSLLVRVPRGVTPGKQAVIVETTGGGAIAKLATSIYAYGGDTQGDALHFRRFGPESPGFEEEELSIELEKARFLELSADGGMLYAIQKPVFKEIFGVGSKVNTAVKIGTKIMGGDVTVNLLVVHMGAKDEPELVRTVPLTLSSKPTGMACADGVLVVLQKTRLTVLDLADPTAPREVAKLDFPADSDCELIDAGFLAKGNTSLAVLEAYANEVHLVDLSDPSAPRLSGSARLSKAIGEPFSIDMVLSADGNSAWVLQGPNMRLAGKRLLDGLKSIGRNLLDFELGDALDTAGETVGRVSMPAQEGLTRVVQVGLVGGALKVGASIPLPAELFPFFVVSDGKGSLYVSAINRYTFDFSRLELSMDGLMELLGMLKDMVQLGRVMKVSLADGQVSTVLEGVAIYYDMSVLPNGQLLVSTIRLGPGYLPPRVTLDWGLEVPGNFAKLREIANTTTALSDALKKLMPPYDYERIGVQR